MRFQHVVPLLSLSGAALAAPAPARQQKPLMGESSPYNKDHYDPYDYKYDSYARNVQPLPMVSITTMFCAKNTLDFRYKLQASTNGADLLLA